MFRRFSRLLSLSLSLSLRFFMRHQYGLEGRGVGGLRAPRLGVDLFTQIITQKESTAGRFSARAREKKRERERERVSTFHSQPMLTPPQPLPPSSPSSSSSPSLYFFLPSSSPSCPCTSCSCSFSFWGFFFRLFPNFFPPFLWALVFQAQHGRVGSLKN